jgi:effector-binding domain-containing protein
LRDGSQLTYRELPAVATMATYVLQGSFEKAHLAYGEIGTWAEINGYRFADAPREIVLRLPQEADGSDGITEIQYPIEPLGHAQN